MSNITRNISLWLRQRSEQKLWQKTIQQFAAWSKDIESLPIGQTNTNSIAIVRLDDIGDYILWRNFLQQYRNAPAFHNQKITLIGNQVWRSIFEQFDAPFIDDCIWIDKSKYLNDADYRMSIWQNVRQNSFHTIICPARTRPLLLDDIICLAANSPQRIACNNTLPSKKLNLISDALYSQHFTNEMRGLEFFFNRTFTSFATKSKSDIEQPFFKWLEQPETNHKQIVCFIGASAKSKTWPATYWIQLVKLIEQSPYNVVLLGGKNELPLSQQIVAATAVNSLVGQTNLVQSIQLIAASKAVISGDSMAAHAAVACKKYCVILANGVNAKRFGAYQESGFGFVKTIYTKEFLKSNQPDSYRAVSKDMHSILPIQVWEAIEDLLS